MELQDAKGLSGYIASGAGVLGPSSVAMETYPVQLGNTHVGFSIVFFDFVEGTAIWGGFKSYSGTKYGCQLTSSNEHYSNESSV